MKKKIYTLILILFIAIIIDGVYKLQGKYSLMENFIFNQNNNLIFLSGKIKNMINYKDDELQLSINNVLGIKKEVYIYQWIEHKKHLKKVNKYVYTYEKQWVKHSVDSSNFKDKSKNNFTNKTYYKEKEIIPEQLIFGDDYMIKNKFFQKKINFENYFFNKKHVYGKVIDKEFKGKFIESNTYSDLDSYISSNDKVFAKDEREKFTVINNYILFNGIDFNNPNIGDIKIIYKIFNADFISFMGSVNGKNLNSYNNFFAIYLEEKNKEEILFKEKIKFILEFFIFINVSVFLINKILLILKSKIYRNVTLRYIPYFSEYFVYSKNHKINILLFFLLLIVIIFKIYYLLFSVAVIFVCLRNIDYYSI